MIPNSLSIPAVNSSSRFTVAAAPYYQLRDFSTMSSSNPSLWKIHNVSDPYIIFDNNYYYCFSTDYMVNEGPSGSMLSSIQVRRSLDLIKWDWYGTALSALPPDAVAHVVSGQNRAWAPHVEKMQDKYFLYYSASRFGTTLSYIGVLSSTAITGPWINLGEVYKTSLDSNENAIDPNICLDKDSNPWMVYGSYFDGIFLVRIDPSTGKLLTGGTKYNIAKRPAVGGLSAVEGAFITYNPDYNYYYLFTSFGQCCNDSIGQPLYNVRVTRSADITGTYIGFNGLSATDLTTTPSTRIGNKLMGGYKFGTSTGWEAPGHNAVFKKGKDYFTVHHARLDFDFPWNYLHVRRIVWSVDGWPLFLPQRYAGETLQRVTSAMLIGNYQHLTHVNTTTALASSFDLALLATGILSTVNDSAAGFWESTSTNTLTLSFAGAPGGGYFIDNCFAYPVWDWELNKSTIGYTGRSQFNVHSWGKKV